jgi:hypothetical protein
LVNSEAHKVLKVHKGFEELPARLAQLEPQAQLELTVLLVREVLTVTQVPQELTATQQPSKLGPPTRAYQGRTPRLLIVGQFKTPFSTSRFHGELTQ